VRLLSASDLLGILERGRDAAPAQQALTLLEIAFPDASIRDLSRLTIGQRDGCLLRLRELTFGSQLKGLADCPNCHERLELVFELSDLYVRNALFMDGATIEPIQAEYSFHMNTYEVTYRLPTNADLMTLSTQQEPTQVSEFILEACLVSVHKDDASIKASDLPPDVLNALVEKIEQADPLANLTLAARCPACEHTWQIVFDVVSYLWTEVNTWATRLLREVHILASAYGWREADILAMSAWRRQRYLEMIGI